MKLYDFSRFIVEGEVVERNGPSMSSEYRLNCRPIGQIPISCPKGNCGY